MNVSAYLEKFGKLAMAAGFSCEVMSEIDGYDIPAFTRAGIKNAPRIYISSGMHGDEPSGPQALMEMMEEGRFQKDIEWFVCPMINPTGHHAGKRENKEGIDLNRDYFLKSTDEIRGHVKWLEKQSVPDVFISLHEDWESTGFYLYEIQKHACTSVAQSILTAASAEIEPEPSLLIDDHEVREPGWIFHDSRADFPGDWPEAIYMAERGTQVSYTLETPSSLALERRVACHQLAVCKAVEEFMLTQGA